MILPAGTYSVPLSFIWYSVPVLRVTPTTTKPHQKGNCVRTLVEPETQILFPLPPDVRLTFHALNTQTI